MNDKKLAKLVVEADEKGVTFKNDEAAERFERAVKEAKKEK